MVPEIQRSNTAFIADAMSALSMGKTVVFTRSEYVPGCPDNITKLRLFALTFQFGKEVHEGDVEEAMRAINEAVKFVNEHNITMYYIFQDGHFCGSLGEW